MAGTNCIALDVHVVLSPSVLVRIYAIRQTNGYDCGVFTCVFAERLAQSIREPGAHGALRPDMSDVTPAFIANQRVVMLRTIADLEAAAAAAAAGLAGAASSAPP